MTAERSLTYASALLDVARSEGALADVEDELFRFSRLLEGNDELRTTLTDAALPVSRRQQIVEDLLGGRANPVTTSLVSMVVGTGRARDLPAIVGELVKLSAAEANKEVAEVRSAIELTDDQKQRLAAALEASTGKKVELKVIIDPTVLGGLIAQVGDTVIDGSVKTSLAQLKTAFERVAPATRRIEKEENTKMAELTINTADIAAALRKNLEGFTPEMAAAQVGRVIEVGDGIATVSGLPGVGVNELLEFEGGVRGLALNLDEESIGAVVLGDGGSVSEGSPVKATGQILSVPAGDGLLGRVVDALGVPVDGKGPLTNVQDRRMELQAPGIIGRKPVHEPLQTGIKAIDAMTPIGRGQRELIIGDRKTGKTTVAVDTILNQRGLGVKCIYVAIGLKESTVANTVATLEQYGAMEYTVVVVAGASDPAPFKYLAPYAGCAMGQHWMENGEHGLIVYDDLSKQAEAYRQVSLLLRRPPGREAYPGDVFYLHSRLLERAAKLSDANGAGSLTALPIIETKAGDISAYIPTNVISITDGQVFLQDDLFKSGVRPAFDTGQSVSRVGGAAQIKAMRKAVGTLKGDLSQFRELEAFAAFGSELDKVSQAALDRGYRLVELLKQPLNSPMPVEEQVVSLYAATNGYLDPVPVADVPRFEVELLDWFRGRHAGILDSIKTTGDIGDMDAFVAALDGFASSFEPTGGRVDEPDAQAQADDERIAAGGAAEAILPEEEIVREDGEGGTV